MAELLSYFTPKMYRKNYLKMKAVVADEEFVTEKACAFDDRITGIVNRNYESLIDEDDISVDSLAVALHNLEEKKKCLEEEINNLYKDEIGYDDLLEIVTKILATSRVAIPSTIQDDDVADIDDCFEMLKSTAAFVDKRLKRIKTKPKPDLKPFREVVQSNEEGSPTFTEDVLSEVDYKSCLESTKEGDINNSEFNVLQDDKSNLEDVNPDGSIEAENEFVNPEKDSNTSSGEETLTKRVSYEDFVNNIDAKDAASKDNLVGRENFGPQKTRWSFKKVFQKKK